MWKKREQINPKKIGLYKCFGTVNKGSEFQARVKFNASFNGELFVDVYGEDLIEIDKSVEFWFDFDEVENPI